MCAKLHEWAKTIDILKSGDAECNTYRGVPLLDIIYSVITSMRHETTINSLIGYLAGFRKG